MLHAIFSLLIFTLAASAMPAAVDAPAYFPPPAARGGWRTPRTADEVRRRAGGMDRAEMDRAFAAAAASTKNGGLLVLRDGWLIYEKYFGKGHREAAPNLGSCGKSFTSISIGILLAERPELFPDGLDQKIFTPRYLPPEAFPLSDPAKAGIKLGQLLSFSAGIRGNNPAMVKGKEVTIDPAGPDGWPSMVDAVALGRRDAGKFSAATLWCPPGGGYSYASSSIHVASIVLRHVSGMELQEYVRTRLAEPLGWGPWSFGYRSAKEVTHTPGAGGIALRATDMLRFGYLLLNEGRWGERQLVPADYVRACGRPSPYNPHAPYSLQFDVNADGRVAGVPRDAFWKQGSGGHVFYIVPSLRLVVWKLGGRDSQYEKNDTGMEMTSDVMKAMRAGSAARANWKQELSDREACGEVLRRVVSALE